MEQLRKMTEEQSRMIFAASCIEATARREHIPATEMYARMSRVGIIIIFSLITMCCIHRAGSM